MIPFSFHLLKLKNYFSNACYLKNLNPLCDISGCNLCLSNMHLYVNPKRRRSILAQNFIWIIWIYMKLQHLTQTSADQSNHRTIERHNMCIFVKRISSPLSNRWSDTTLFKVWFSHYSTIKCNRYSMGNPHNLPTHSTPHKTTERKTIQRILCILYD